MSISSQLYTHLCESYIACSLEQKVVLELLFSLTYTSYQIGEVFVHSTMEDTNKLVEAAKENLQKDIEDIEKKCEAHKGVLSNLKVHLYAKFGNNINLEADDETATPASS